MLLSNNYLNQLRAAKKKALDIILAYTSLLTKQNDLAVFDDNTRKTCTDACKVNRVLQTRVTNSFLILECFIL